MSVSERAAEAMVATSVTFEEAARNVHLAMQPVMEKSCRNFAHLCQVIDEAQQDGPLHHSKS